MENKHVGYLLLGVSALIVGVIYLFNRALKELIRFSCGDEHAVVCPMNHTVDTQTYISLGVVALLVAVAVLLIRAKPQVVVKTVKKKPKAFDTTELRKDEREVFDVIREKHAIFQAELIEKTGFGKARMTRIIDRLEGRGFVERKRRGMTNVVVLKED